MDASNPQDATQNLGSLGTQASPSDKLELCPGLKLGGRYLIERELGRGGIGVVYLARDERLHSMPVVIKFLLESNSQNTWLQKKFFQEVEALSRLNHPGIVKIIDKDRTQDGKPFFVMEFVSGNPLRSVLTPDGLDFEYAAYLLRQIGQALGAAHREGIFHRDLKPENIILQVLQDGDEQIKLIDFGLAKVKNSDLGSSTEIAMVAGSLNYIAPEQLLSHPVSAATDIYALATIAYEMVTGRRPFNLDAPNSIAAAQQLITLQQSEDIVSPKRLRPSLTEAAQAIILQGLSFQSANRPQDVRAFGEALAEALTGQTTFRQPAAQQTAVVEQRAQQPTVVVNAEYTDNFVQQPTVKISALPELNAATTATSLDKTRRGKGIIWGLAAVFIIAALVGGIFFGRRFLTPSPVPTSSPASTTAQPASNLITEPERLLTYSITLQKDPKRYPGSKPFQLPGEVIFSVGDRVRLTFTSPQSGFLYIINEAPEISGNKSSFNVLFPSSTSNNGSAQLQANQAIQIPERGDGFVFDAEEGTEKLWLVWSANPVTDLEALKKWANPTDRGEIKDAAQTNTLRDLFAKPGMVKPDIEKDEVKKQTSVKGKGEMLIKLINLEHH